MVKRILLAICLLATPVLAANHFIRAGAGGASPCTAGWGAGQACSALPTTLVRGDTYYIAAGTYGGHDFNDAASGTSVITIKAATIADHGSATNWSDSYVGEAKFNTVVSGSILSFNQPYYVFDGAYRGTDWISGYGFHIDASSGNVGNDTGIVAMGASNITIRYTNIEGSHSQGAPRDRAITSYGNSNLLFDKIYAHDVGNANFVLRGGCTVSACNSPLAQNLTLQYSYVSVDFSNPAVGHAEGISFAEGVANIAYRYNRFVNVNGTGAMATANSRTNTVDAYNGPFYIYGNQFYLNPSLWPSWYSTWCQVGGFFTHINIKNAADIHVYNNTIGNVNSTNCTAGSSHDGGINFDNDGLGTGSVASGVVVHAKNNLWYNSNGGVSRGAIPVGQTDFSNNDDTALSAAFVSTSGYDFHLSGHRAGTALSNVGTYWNGTALVANTFNVDADGTTRTGWDLGAFEYASGVTTYGLTITGGTGGTVTSADTFISCGSTCTHTYNSGDSVTLTATPTTGYSFTGWSGDCSGTSTCALTMTATKAATATFGLTATGTAMKGITFSGTVVVK